MSSSWLLRQRKEIELASTKGPLYRILRVLLPSLSWFCHSLFQIYLSKSLSKTEWRFPNHPKTVAISAERKGQLFSKCLLGVFNFSQKTNKNKSTWDIIVVNSKSFIHFLGEIEDIKKTFRNYPTFIACKSAFKIDG